MNTEIIFAVTALVTLIVAAVLTVKYAPRRRPHFMFHLVNATFRTARPAAWRPAPPALLSRRRRWRKPPAVESRIAEETEPIQSAVWDEERDAAAEAVR